MSRIEFTPPIDIASKTCKATTADNQEINPEKLEEYKKIADAIWDTVTLNLDKIEIESMHLPPGMQEQFLLRLANHQTPEEIE